MSKKVNAIIDLAMNSKKETPEVKETQEKGLLGLMRVLRPQLPSDTEKLDEFTYLIGKRFELKLHYYCLVTPEGKDRTKECFPHKITLSDGYSGRSRYRNENRIRTKTFHIRKDGTFNIPAILSAVKDMQDLLKSIEKERELKVQKQEEMMKEREKKRQEMKMYWESMKCDPFVFLARPYDGLNAYSNDRRGFYVDVTREYDDPNEKDDVRIVITRKEYINIPAKEKAKIKKQLTAIAKELKEYNKQHPVQLPE